MNSAARIAAPPSWNSYEHRAFSAGASRFRYFAETNGGSPVIIGVGHLQPLVALIAGIIILLVPRILNYVIAIYLILIGIIGLGIIR